ncbi:hypothetical protein IFM89_021816 [Coptis chinensis]|uniref:Uncharacterized protein n=1 Tax=Coptis chinensis TaxID=261450 RepID=A0A835HMP7_9MAGN|nr:hypothetical protein IFM89_021816 [Coptis chinensis]
MVPKARVAAYKVYWNTRRYDHYILAAFDVDVCRMVCKVISLSVGGVVKPYYLDTISIGSFVAIDHGVFVSVSASNGGITVMNVASCVCADCM